MATLKYWDATAGEYRVILAASKGDKGDPGPQGPPGQDGQDGVAGSLNQLSDVTVAPDTPVGKYLGTTGTGAWGAVDPQDLSGYLTISNAAATYVAQVGDVMTGALGMGTNRIYGLGEPIADDHAATKKYVDDNVPAAVQNGWARKGATNNQVIASGAEAFITLNSAESLSNVTIGSNYLEPQIAGFWVVSLKVYCPQGPWITGGRAFIGITSVDTGEYTRQSIGIGEDSQGATALIHLTALERVYFKIYHEFGSSRQMSGAFEMKYLGPADD